MFPVNTWYVACSADEIDEKPLGRTICNQAIVFYRAHEGKVAAVEDFCPHRGAPLSLGYVCEGKLVCGYHGLEMGCDGKTIAMPGQRVRGFPEIRSYPVEERHGFIWIWPGDPAKAAAVAGKLRAGMVAINNWGPAPGAPFGGYKQSGNGREGGLAGLKDFMEMKAISGFPA